MRKYCHLGNHLIQSMDSSLVKKRSILAYFAIWLAEFTENYFLKLFNWTEIWTVWIHILGGLRNRNHLIESTDSWWWQLVAKIVIKVVCYDDTFFLRCLLGREFGRSEGQFVRFARQGFERTLSVGSRSGTERPEDKEPLNAPLPVVRLKNNENNKIITMKCSRRL